MIIWADPATAAATVAQIQFRAVRESRSLYSEAQRQAWLPESYAPEVLQARLSDAQVALYRRGDEYVGVMTVEPGGYVNLAFILPEHQGTGVFRALAEAVEAAARTGSEMRLWTFASLMAQPAFQRMGFSVMHHEEVERNGLMLPRAKMEKRLS